MVRKRAQLLALQVKEETQDSISKVAATDSVRGVREFHLRSEQAGFPVVRVSSTFIAHWAQKLAIEVGDLLRLAAVEWWSAKQEADQMMLEERQIAEEARCEMNVMDSFLASVQLQTNLLQGFKKQKGGMSTALVELNCGSSGVKELGFSSEGLDVLTADNARKGDLQENASISDVRTPGGGIHCARIQQ
jgi:hypothetical protein